MYGVKGVWCKRVSEAVWNSNNLHTWWMFQPERLVKQLVWCHNCLMQKLLRVPGVKVFCCKSSLA